MPLRAEVVPTRRVLVVAAAVVTASLALFVLIAENLVNGGGLISHDHAVLSWFVDHRTDRSISVARFLSTIGSFLSLFLLGVVIGVWLWRRRRDWRLAAAPLVALSLGGLASSLAKAVFDRPRPPVAAHATSVSTAAFPSGHATDAAAFFLAASFTLAITVTRRRWAQTVLVVTGSLLAGLVGLSRLVLGVHWLSDVVAGWALGTAAATTVVVTLWYLDARRRTPPAAPVVAGPA
jgi:undecaprenyl-diphosphatase